ncbi:hypothetical protein BDA99DRAFT_558927 [Phascolomyces articulosus]|uniref:Uncharacterized protein n=1 Tax=Phascolomyces articulosus TaxID=60185 RepID=A0AAD5PFL9_9FUNG|nr:hypothetical protein BDA99DRAFT_558927 [Phascolomyces articulosus]
MKLLYTLSLAMLGLTSSTVIYGAALADEDLQQLDHQISPAAEENQFSCLPASCVSSGCCSGNCGYWCRVCGISYVC